MWVKALPGLKCPKEGSARSYITDIEPVQVEPTSYYLRLIGDGSLIEVPKPAPAKLKGPSGPEVSERSEK